MFFEGAPGSSYELFHVISFSPCLWHPITHRSRSPREHPHPGRTLCLSGHHTLTWPWYSSPSIAPRGSAWPWKTSILGSRTTSPISSTSPSQAGRYITHSDDCRGPSGPTVCPHRCAALCPVLWGTVQCRESWNCKQVYVSQREWLSSFMKRP